MWRERKTHRYFKCPNCKTMVRVPKGKGKIVITCTRCHHEIVKRTWNNDKRSLSGAGSFKKFHTGRNKKCIQKACQAVSSGFAIWAFKVSVGLSFSPHSLINIYFSGYFIMKFHIFVSFKTSFSDFLGKASEIRIYNTNPGRNI